MDIINHQSDYEIVKRLEDSYQHLSLMLKSLESDNSVKILLDIDDGIENLIQRLGDTQTILKLVLRERKLEQKLANLELEIKK